MLKATQLYLRLLIYVRLQRDIEILKIKINK